MNVTFRLKQSRSMLRLIEPTSLTSNNFIYPIFVREDGKTYAIPSMNNQNYLSIEGAVDVCSKVVDAGVPAVLVFGVISHRDADASVAVKEGNFHGKVFSALKKEFGDKLVLISNVCLCDYTKDDFCVYSDKGQVLSEKTAKMLARIAVVHAGAGADVIAPAAMCDGQVKHIRQALDDSGLCNTVIMSYIKTDSCLFRPFYEAMADSNVQRNGIDSSKFRSDVINDKLFMQKVSLDLDEGADMIIVKPALVNLDLILRVKQSYPTTPIAAYQVSGEYMSIKLLSENTNINEDTMIMESLNSIRRAGADMIITYNALRAVSLINHKKNK